MVVNGEGAMGKMAGREKELKDGIIRSQGNRAPARVRKKGTKGAGGGP